jgi:hypothetical protein
MIDVFISAFLSAVLVSWAWIISRLVKQLDQTSKALIDLDRRVTIQENRYDRKYNVPTHRTR